MEGRGPGGHPVRSGPSGPYDPGVFVYVCESVCGCDMKSMSVAKIYHVNQCLEICNATRQPYDDVLA
jgi:hypothetical protein